MDENGVGGWGLTITLFPRNQERFSNFGSLIELTGPDEFCSDVTEKHSLGFSTFPRKLSISSNFLQNVLPKNGLVLSLMSFRDEKERLSKRMRRSR